MTILKLLLSAQFKYIHWSCKLLCKYDSQTPKVSRPPQTSGSSHMTNKMWCKKLSTHKVWRIRHQIATGPICDLANSKVTHGQRFLPMPMRSPKTTHFVHRKYSFIKSSTSAKAIYVLYMSSLCLKLALHTMTANIHNWVCLGGNFPLERLQNMKLFVDQKVGFFIFVKPALSAKHNKRYSWLK